MTSHILVVDDDPSIRELVQAMLQEEGYVVETAVDGQDALARASERTPALVLLDLMMPVLDGRQTHAVLRERLPAVPVVYVSASAVPAAEVARHGARGYLRKPFELAELIDVVERLTAA